MRSWCYLLILAGLPAAQVGAQDAPYYGPMKAWHGIGFKFGYKDDVQKDGSWRIVASTRRGDAIDMAMYRAAELAREQGYQYVELLGGSTSSGPGISSATLYMRPSRTAAAPAQCRSKRRGGCYTAVVAQVLRGLGGTGGSRPGTPVVDHFDRYGRAVSYSGYGVGAASAAPAPRVAPPPPAWASPPTVVVAPTATERYQQLLKAAQPVRSDPKRGWTVSD